MEHVNVTLVFSNTSCILLPFDDVICDSNGSDENKWDYQYSTLKTQSYFVMFYHKDYRIRDFTAWSNNCLILLKHLLLQRLILQVHIKNKIYSIMNIEACLH